MSCPENPADCPCPPPGGAGYLTLPELTGGLPWYYPWEVDATLAFQVTNINGSHASGHIIAYDGLFKRINVPIAATHTQLDTYLLARAEQLAERALKIAAAKVAFHDQAGVEWPDYPTGGVIYNDNGPLALSSTAIFVPFNYPAAGCRIVVDEVNPLICTATFSTGNGWRTLRGPRVLHRGSEFNEFQRQQNIWVPLYNAAIAAVDSEYPVPVV